MDLFCDSSGPPLNTDRRIDVTIERLRSEFEQLSDTERLRLTSMSAWSAIDTVLCLRSMERAEEEVLGRPCGTLADRYDRLVTPGEHAGDALVKVFRDIFRDAGQVCLEAAP